MLRESTDSFSFTEPFKRSLSAHKISFVLRELSVATSTCLMVTLDNNFLSPPSASPIASQVTADKINSLQNKFCYDPFYFYRRRRSNNRMIRKRMFPISRPSQACFKIHFAFLDKCGVITKMFSMELRSSRLCEIPLQKFLF